MTHLADQPVTKDMPNSLDVVSHFRYIYSMSNPMSFRLSDTALTLLARLCSALGLKRSGVLELAIRELAKKHGVKEE